MLVTDWPGANRFLPPRRGMPRQFSKTRMPDNNTGNRIVPFTMLPGYMEDEERYETRRVFDQLNRDAKEDILLELLARQNTAAAPAPAPAAPAPAAVLPLPGALPLLPHIASPHVPPAPIPPRPVPSPHVAHVSPAPALILDAPPAVGAPPHLELGIPEAEAPEDLVPLEPYPDFPIPPAPGADGSIPTDGGTAPPAPPPLPPASGGDAAPGKTSKVVAAKPPAIHELLGGRARLRRAVIPTKKSTEEKKSTAPPLMLKVREIIAMRPRTEGPQTDDTDWEDPPVLKPATPIARPALPPPPDPSVLLRRRPPVPEPLDPKVAEARKKAAGASRKVAETAEAAPMTPDTLSWLRSGLGVRRERLRSHSDSDSEHFYSATLVGGGAKIHHYTTSRHHPHGQTRPCLPVHWSS